MPSKNIVKEYAPDSYYHIYNRGVNKRLIFRDDQDYAVFLNILKRHLSDEVIKDNFGREYDNFGSEIELLAFCLMPNHFHMFIYQSENWRALEALMRRVVTAYSMYFNKKYKRVGHLFQDSYKASRIDDEAYLQHISRYIHLNPVNYKDYEWSSYKTYTGKVDYKWVKPKRILDIFNSTNEYISFIDNFKDYKETEEALSRFRAD